jgi:hypothetical protein
MQRGPPGNLDQLVDRLFPKQAGKDVSGHVSVRQGAVRRVGGAGRSVASVLIIGIIGGGLMGREAASAFARWFALVDFPVKAELVAVCDVQPEVLAWFRQVPTVRCLTADHRELLARADVDVVYVAVPHHLHETIYLDVLRAGKDLLAEKPFGVDLAAARPLAPLAAGSLVAWVGNLIQWGTCSLPGAASPPRASVGFNFLAQEHDGRQ